ncbi:MAG TPA: transcriptional activator NhaR [Bryobacteraceae bacterium]|nr:transcriptional activator NhaR [Bryobacteraceae bacterium]
MEWLNYHHLLYFWCVAKEGSIARACEKLRLAQPTISGQLRLLEETLGEKLFVKQGRGLALTEVGQVVYRYADEIFSLGRELQDVLKGRPRGRPLRLFVGISDLVPKLIAYRVLRPALEMAEPVQMVCDEDTPDRLLAELAEHRMDVVLSESPIPPTIPVKAFNHLLGTSTVTVFGAPRLAARFRKNFPACLDGAPFLLPMEGSSLRRALEQWFDSENIRPKLVGEFRDGALMKTFGQAGAGVFTAPSAIEKEIHQHYGVSPIGRIDSVVERYYAISVERKLKHPAVVTISEAARAQLFGQAS